MAGVSRVVLLAGGRRPLLPLEAAEIVCSFLHLRPVRAFNTFPLLFEDLRECPLHFLLDALYRTIYLEPTFDRDGVVTAGYLSIRYAIAVIQYIGVGTDYGRTLLQSVFLAPGVASTWPFENDRVFGHQLPQSVADSPGFAWTALVSPPHRLSHLLREAVVFLSGHMFAWPHEDVDYIELREDFDHLMSILGLEDFEELGEGLEHGQQQLGEEDGDDDAAYLQDQRERRWAHGM
jgi:hypothetical protein